MILLIHFLGRKKFCTPCVNQRRFIFTSRSGSFIAYRDPSLFNIRGRKTPRLCNTNEWRSEFTEHLIHFVAVDRWIIPPQTVAVGFTEGFQDRHQGIISAVPIDPCQAVKVLLIADPEGSAPGLPVCPSVHAVLLCLVLSNSTDTPHERRAPMCHVLRRHKLV